MTNTPNDAGPEASGVSSLPTTLGDLDYRVQGLLSTDSKMSEILVATDRKAQKVIFKIACVQQRARADANRQAIQNSVIWLQQLGKHAGIAQLQPIVRKGASRLRARFTPPCFIATLPDWPGNPDFLINEYLAGGTLSSFVGRRPLPVTLAVGIAHDLAQTLTYLHAHFCVHRDLKPENVLFRVTPTRTASVDSLQPVLIDFGIAARIGEPKLISGSRLWMAPELQAAYEKALIPVDATWDVYALGLICCYMLSGVRPRRKQHAYQDYTEYQERVFAQLAQDAANADAVWQQVTQSLRQVLEQTLDSDPRKRPTAAAFAAQMAALLTEMGIESPSRRTHRTRIWQELAKIPLTWQFIGLALVIISTLLVLVLAVQIRLPLGFSVIRQAPVAQATAEHVPDVVQLRSQTIVLQQTPILSPATETRRWLSTPTSTAATPLPTSTAATPLPTPTAATPLPTPTLLVSLLISQEEKITGAATTVIRLSLTSPPPTLATLSTPAVPPSSIPTLVSFSTAAVVAPPTLAPFTPTMTPTALPPTPTATHPAPTGTATVPLPTQTALPPATPQRSPTLLGAIRLAAPPSGVVAAQERVEFSWEITGSALAPDHCYELVFWDPAKEGDKRSPIGASRTASGTVNFNKLRESPDPLLRRLAQSPQGFAWGVRLVSCTSPTTVLQDVNEGHHYTYQP